MKRQSCHLHGHLALGRTIPGHGVEQGLGKKGSFVLFSVGRFVGRGGFQGELYWQSLVNIEGDSNGLTDRSSISISAVTCRHESTKKHCVLALQL
jgi:hypothetical protein